MALASAASGNGRLAAHAAQRGRAARGAAEEAVSGDCRTVVGPHGTNIGACTVTCNEESARAPQRDRRLTKSVPKHLQHITKTLFVVVLGTVNKTVKRYAEMRPLNEMLERHA